MEGAKTQVSVIGLGAMGREIARNLLAADYDVTVWNRSPEPVNELIEEGATAAQSPEQAFSCEVVLTTLFGDEAVRTVLVENDVLKYVSANTTHICMSTVSNVLSRELIRFHDQAEVDYASAPMFGRPEAAKAGKLNILLAGSSVAAGKAEPVLEVLGRVWRMGTDPNHAHLAKIAGNSMIVEAWHTMSEATAVLNAHGADAEQFMSIMGQTLFSAPIYQAYGPSIAAGNGLDSAAMSIALKDNRLMRQAGKDGQVPTPIAEQVHDLLHDASEGTDEGG
ncbi:NAD(P)-dependent oxidoreductase [Chromohalobacter sp. 296-RDG]|uniref:NAD(P)-dependent oxidoreductase n=2 Tax=unclassified Chromohalobacter TaxID=2628571 RepID=UPI0024684616|nr:NAD(P)-dependent oxidoreductase [Chromohalobacter sp. 296-RDG]